MRSDAAAHASRKPTLPWPQRPKRYGTFSRIRYSTMISAPFIGRAFVASGAALIAVRVVMRIPFSVRELGVGPAGKGEETAVVVMARDQLRADRQAVGSGKYRNGNRWHVHRGPDHV